jgi:Matrixin
MKQFSLKLMLVLQFLGLISCKESRKSSDAFQNLVVKYDTVKPITLDRSKWPTFERDSLYRLFDTVQIASKIYFLTEGDILLTEDELRNRLFTQSKYALLAKKKFKDNFNIAKIDSSKPIIINKDFQEIIISFDPVKNENIKWSNFPIRFCINKSSFNVVPNGYETIKENFNKAIQDWTNLCNVKFEYVDEADNSSNAETYHLDFILTYHYSDASTDYVATSFYPNDSPDKRILFVFPKYWNTDYDKVGVFRHEIGHILGFRHEQTSTSDLVPIDCRRRYSEPLTPSFAVTEYDQESVMHYFCGGNGTRTMQFSAYDTVGITAIYPK